MLQAGEGGILQTFIHHYIPKVLNIQALVTVYQPMESMLERLLTFYKFKRKIYEMHVHRNQHCHSEKLCLYCILQIHKQHTLPCTHDLVLLLLPSFCGLTGPRKSRSGMLMASRSPCLNSTTSPQPKFFQENGTNTPHFYQPKFYCHEHIFFPYSC